MKGALAQAGALFRAGRVWPESRTPSIKPLKNRLYHSSIVELTYTCARDSLPSLGSWACGVGFRLGSWPLWPSRWVGEFMTTMFRKTAQAWLPVLMTAAVVGIGVAVATW